ncbi:MAG: hypothetical protein HY527_12170 [Betaproteobacteria bacterium]|nr:hypothetical protein [Betaproteobacteria bacterium]
MDMHLQEQVAFRLTGQAAGSGLRTVEAVGLRPALLANYRDLTRLRYDFPLVLVRNGPDEHCVRSLSGIIDAVLQEVAPRGPEGERLRKQVLRLEREIRAQTAKGVAGPLSALWDKAARRLVAASDEPLEDNLDRARAALKVEGKLLDCNASTPSRFLIHAWTRCQQTKARRMLGEIGALIVKLSDILRANTIGSEEGRSAESLRAAVGTAHGEVFDFDVMSRLLARVSAGSSLPLSRLRRIQWALSVLKSQRFFRPDSQRAPGGGEEPYAFVFENCTGALDAFRERLPRMIELIKAISVAELEIEGRYSEARHDAFFEAFYERALGPNDLNLFPDYLVCLGGESANATEDARLWELLSSGLPAKILVQTDDILEESTVGEGHFAFGARSARLAGMALGLQQVYVLQSSSSNLLQAGERILRGLRYAGPALFSIYSGAAGSAGDLPPYLNAAAAMQSRAFPAFSYDPSAGLDWASRFSLEQNPQVDRDWTAAGLVYEDESHQRVAENVTFTFVDFVACDPRYARHFAKVARDAWNESMVPVAECLGGAPQTAADKVPYLLMADCNDVLQRVIVDDRLILAADRCRERWRMLQEFGGIRNSHAERLLAREKKAWEEQRQRELESLKSESQVAPAIPAAAAAPVAPVISPTQAESVQEEKSSDEPYIETPRCTSCDECTQINNRMFAYDANKQAYIADLGAGTYRQLVEAAESCQVSIIHPGKPRNPNEAGLDELLQRAEPFL